MKPRNKDKGRIGGPFVPMLNETWKSAAWRAMSPYARIVYISLKSRYGFEARNNGRIYLSARDGTEETGFDMKTVARCLRELEHYGFIVVTKAHCLGVEGRGTATHWRLTELGYMHEPPTKDFMKWNGELFHEQRTPAYYKRQERHLAKRIAVAQKQNPPPSDGTGCTAPRNITMYRQTEQLPERVYRATEHISEPACTVPRNISRINHSAVPIFQLPAVRPDSRAVDAYLAAWVADEGASALA
jgi:hypothetical protein